MKGTKPAEPAKGQLLYEKALWFATWLLGTVYLVLSAFRYAVDYTLFAPYIRWFAILLIVAVLAYILITRIKYPQTFGRIKDFLKGMKSYEQIFLAALFVWFVITCLIRQWSAQYNYMKVMDWWLLDAGICGLVFFPMAYYLPAEKKKFWLDLMLHITALPYTVFSIYGLWNLFSLNIVTLPSGSQIGMSGYFFYLGCHYNIAGAIAFVILAIACYMMFNQKIVWKIIYGIVAVIQLLVCNLTNSRTVYVCVLFLGFACTFLLGWNLLKEKKLSVRLIISGTAAVACVLALWKLRSASFTLFDSVTHYSELLSAGSASASSSSVSSTAVANDASRALDGLSGREGVWTGAVKGMISSPEVFFFGVTPLDVPYVIRDFGSLGFEPAHAHNIILQVGIGMGVPAMIAFIIFLVKMAINCVRSVWKVTGKALNYFGMTVIVIASLVLMNMAEAYLVAYYSVMGSVFFLACGVIAYREKRINRDYPSESEQKVRKV